ncbi:MAG TPA: CotH kinase family protein, partial [Phycisphaerales bacterium]|nr:CotH kinase family protein [Phycisphaerales bacterium]
DGDGRLNIAEREEARAFLKKERAGRPGRMGGPGGMGGGDEEGKPGPIVTPGEVQPASGDFYDATVVRTVFLDFDSSDWEQELEDFVNTDVEVPATMTVDGKKYNGVGVHFRGQSSFFGVRPGSKRSLNISTDFTDEKQVLRTAGATGGKEDRGYRTLNFLNSHEDASFMSSVLYSTIANRYLIAPRANYVRVVVNGESWGVYVNVEQFNKDFVRRHFPQQKGATKDGVKGREARWKVKGNPGARSGLEYTGESLQAYKQKYEIKSADNEQDWRDLVKLCKVLNTTPADELVGALSPMLDIDATLRFLALDNALANGDGYWTRSSDYSIYKDEGGKFHIIPHDMNEAFRSSLMMPGGGRGPGGGQARRPGAGGPPAEPAGGGGEERRPPRQDDQQPPEAKPDEPPETMNEQRQPVARPPRRGGGAGGPGMGRGVSGTELDPLIGLDDPAKPLRSKLLAVPELRERYLRYVKEIAEKDLDWATLGPIVEANRALIEEHMEEDTRKLGTLEAFRRATAEEPQAGGAGEKGRREPMNLRAFVDKRRAYLLSYTPKTAAAADTGQTK